MRCLAKNEADTYLLKVGMEVGDWNEVRHLPSAQGRALPRSAHVRVGRDGRGLLYAAQVAAGWLPRGQWKILQLDNSNHIDPTLASFLGRLLFGRDVGPILMEHSSFLFEFGSNEQENDRAELLIANLIFILLLFEGHGYVVSAGTATRQLLGVQDGFLYFIADDDELSGGGVLADSLKRNDAPTPQWVLEVEERYYERTECP